MNAPLQILNCPATLVRAYGERAHADRFLAEGYLRLQKLQYYRTLEDNARQDASEGEGRLKVPALVSVVTINKRTLEHVAEHKEPGHLNYSMTFQNPTYLLCLSDACVDIDMLMKRFGRHVVEIFNPSLLFERLHGAALSLAVPGRILAEVDCFPVRYDKDSVAPEPADLGWQVRIAYGQKAPTFAWEREYRCAVILSGPAADSPDRLELSLGESSDIARRCNLDRPTAR